MAAKGSHLELPALGRTRQHGVGRPKVPPRVLNFPFAYHPPHKPPAGLENSLRLLSHFVLQRRFGFGGED